MYKVDSAYQYNSHCFSSWCNANVGGVYANEDFSITLSCLWQWLTSTWRSEGCSVCHLHLPAPPRRTITTWWRATGTRTESCWCREPERLPLTCPTTSHRWTVSHRERRSHDHLNNRVKNLNIIYRECAVKSKDFTNTHFSLILTPADSKINKVPHVQQPTLSKHWREASHWECLCSFSARGKRSVIQRFHGAIQIIHNCSFSKMICDGEANESSLR